MNKLEILDKIIEQEESYIVELEKTLGQFRSASDLDEQETMDRQDMSQANEAKDMQMRMRVQLDKANIDLEEVKSLKDNAHDTVASGALVETDKAYFFIGVSIHNVEVKGKDLYGVSSESPAFKLIFGKSKGDSFKLGDNTYKILEVG